jgi:hypothetical protein
VRRTDRRRVVRVTDPGRENLPETLGLAPDWDQPTPDGEVRDQPVDAARAASTG